MPRSTQAVCVRHPQAEVMETLDPGRDYPDDDVYVQAYPWAFAPVPDVGKIREHVTIEDASAEPGRKRARAK